MTLTAAERPKLRDSLLAALAYFDLFDFPLTLTELRRWRWGGPATEPELADILEALAAAPVGESNGHYFLAGRQDLVARRQRRYRLAERKFKLARRFAWWAGRLPSVRIVAVCNSLALANAEAGSDIDLFIVCRPGTLWITRLLLAGALKILRLRPMPTDQADKFCLSFFLAEDRLDISSLALPGGDVYLRYWLAALAPVYDAGGIWDAFVRANVWVRKNLPGSYPVRPVERRTVPPSRGFGWLLPILYRLEDAAKRLQALQFPSEILRLANHDSRVVISDSLLKFHVNDRRAFYEQKFRERLARLGLRYE